MVVQRCFFYFILLLTVFPTRRLTIYTHVYSDSGSKSRLVGTSERSIVDKLVDFLTRQKKLSQNDEKTRSRQTRIQLYVCNFENNCSGADLKFSHKTWLCNTMMWKKFQKIDFKFELFMDISSQKNYRSCAS